MSNDVPMPPMPADEVESSLMIWQVYAERLETILCRVGIPLPELPTEDEAMDLLLAEDERYTALAEEFMARELPWLTPEAIQAFREVAEAHGAPGEEAFQRALGGSSRMIDEASMWMLDWMVSGEEPFDETVARKILGDGEAYEKFAAEVSAAKSARDLRKAADHKLLDSDGDVGC